MASPRLLALIIPAFFASSAALADGYTGDLGLGIYSHQGLYQGEKIQTSVLPYVYGEWGSFFGRVDTFGYRAMPLGHGFLEISTRIVQDKMDSDELTGLGVRERKNSKLIGLSTLQTTPLGAFNLSLMQDVGDAKGQIIEGSWIGRIRAREWLTIYPEIGIEYLSAKYVDYHYGVEAGEGGFTAYQGESAASAYFALHTSTPLADNWNLAVTVRNKALATKISDSPIVAKTGHWNAYVAVSYEFK